MCRQLGTRLRSLVRLQPLTPARHVEDRDRRYFNEIRLSISLNSEAQLEQNL